MLLKIGLFLLIVGYLTAKWLKVPEESEIAGRLQTQTFQVGKSIMVDSSDSTNNIYVSSTSNGSIVALRGVLNVDSEMLLTGIRQDINGSRFYAEFAPDGKPNLQLEVEVSLSATKEGKTSNERVECYAVTWRHLANAIKATEVTDCYFLDNGQFEAPNWFGGAEVLEQHWPINDQRSKMQPHVTGDYLTPRWRKNPSYGKYGSVAEAYWLSSAGVAIFVDDKRPLFSSFNADGDGRLCLKGNYVNQNRISDEVQDRTILKYTICNGPNVLQVHRTVSKLFIPRPTGVPDTRMIRFPIWSTWAEYKVHVNQSSVMEFANQILENKFEHSQLEIDDRFSSTYGQFDFDLEKFPNATEMIRKLHELGFRVTTWITPFANPESPAFLEGLTSNFWIADDAFADSTVPALTRWWQGVGAIIDVTNPAAVTWFSDRLSDFRLRYAVDSFKFDAGEVDFLPPRPRTVTSLGNPSRYSTLYANMAAKFGGMVELRSAFRNQYLQTFIRMLDKDSVWGLENGLRSIIPTALLFGLHGYPFILPDMIGGNGYHGDEALRSTVLPPSELFVRWAELTAFLPAMQFSIAPWRYDARTVEISRKFSRLHETLVAPEIERAALLAVGDGSPIIRPLWWIDPTDYDALVCDSEFLIGDGMLVAPILHSGARSRDIYLPGEMLRWKNHFDPDADVISGKNWIRDFPVNLDEIAVFVLVQ